MAVSDKKRTCYGTKALGQASREINADAECSIASGTTLDFLTLEDVYSETIVSIALTMGPSLESFSPKPWTQLGVIKHESLF